MPRADPSSSSASATRHLFRHFSDEQELLRNPYVGSALRAGRMTVAELHKRLSHAARSIEQEDQAAGKSSRGARQAACLIECTLKRRPAAEVARELGFSERQLFRERQSAWTRAVQYLVAADPSGPNEPSFDDAQCNHAARLFSSGERDRATTMLLRTLDGATGLESVMLASLASELHLAANDRFSAAALLARAQSFYVDSSAKESLLCRLTLTLLGELVESAEPKPPALRLNADVADAVVLESGVRWWMVRLATRLLMAKYNRAVARDRGGALRGDGLRAAEAAIALGERVPRLTEAEEFALRLLTAHVDWSQRGMTPRAETALIGNYLTATANGRLSEVAQIASLLASMMIIGGRAGSEAYAQTALAVAKALPEDETACFAALNLAVAELDAGRHEQAARLLTSAGSTHSECVLLAREIGAARGCANDARPPFVNAKALASSNAQTPLQAAYLSRVTAMELERRDDHRGATRLISAAWEIAAHDGDWLSHRTIGRTYRQLTRKPPRFNA
jgi:AraC-like DNA-binding protein